MIFLGYFSSFILLWACRLGDYVTLGGRVAIRDHVSIVSKVLFSQLRAFGFAFLCTLYQTSLNSMEHWVALCNVLLLYRSWLHCSEHFWILLALLIQFWLFFSSCWAADYGLIKHLMVSANKNFGQTNVIPFSPMMKIKPMTLNVFYLTIRVFFVVVVLTLSAIFLQVRLAANSSVTKDIQKPGDYGGFPAVSIYEQPY